MGGRKTGQREKRIRASVVIRMSQKQDGQLLGMRKRLAPRRVDLDRKRKRIGEKKKIQKSTVLQTHVHAQADALQGK